MDTDESNAEDTAVDYHCPTCGSEDVLAYESPDETRVHIYCQESSCGWIHRNRSVGVFRPGGSEYRQSINRQSEA